MVKIKKDNRYCAGHFECDLNFSKWAMVIIQLLYVLFWTIILDSLCKNGYKNFSWILVLIPYVMFFIIFSIFHARKHVNIFSIKSVFI